MSNAVLPSLPGLAWNVQRKPQWATVVKTSVSGREFRSAQQSYPLRRYKLTYEFLRAGSAAPELQQMEAFFNARQGSWDSWLYSDPDDNTATAQAFGAGDGATLSFQLVRSFGGYLEPVLDLNGAPQIFKAGVLQTAGTHYSISATGLVTFTAAPAAAAALTWTGTYYWRCRFLQDALETTQFMRQLWDLKTLEFVTVKP